MLQHSDHERMVQNSCGREFLVAGDSHTWAMGAPRDHGGPQCLVSASAFGRAGYYFVPEGGKTGSGHYWNEVARYSNGRDVVLVWKGNQHHNQYLFESELQWDCYDANLPTRCDNECVLLPRALIKTQLSPTVHPLKAIIEDIYGHGAGSVAVVGTPPPRRDVREFESKIRRDFGEAASLLEVDIDTVQITRPILLLKVWKIIQELLLQTACCSGARFVPVPAATMDADGFLGKEFWLEGDFTHANGRFGSLMLQLSLVS